MVSGESIKNVLDNYTDLLRTYQSQLTNLTTWQGTSRNQLDMKVTNFLEEYNNIISSSSTNSFVSDIAIVEISENYEQILASKKELESLISDGKFEIVSDEDVKIA